MKLTDYLMIFVVVTLPFLIVMDMRTDDIRSANQNKLELDHAIDAAVMDGAASLIEKIVTNQIVLNKERAIQNFYNTLYINLGVESQPILKDKLMGYVPMILITDYDGFYPVVKEAYTNSSGNQVIHDVILPKIYYTYSEGDYVYSFTINEDVTVYNIRTKQFLKGTREDLKVIVPTDIMNRDERFENVRRNTIVSTLERTMDFYINRHNHISRQLGITHHFNIPIGDNIDWYTTVDDIGMIVFFQGMPYGKGNRYYNNFAVGGSMIKKRDDYYIEIDGTTGIPYYHKMTCSFLKDMSHPVDNCKEAALEGAFPCKVCKP